VSEKEVLKIMKKDPFIGSLYEEVKKRFPRAYVKYGNKPSARVDERPNLVAIPFTFLTVYVGVRGDSYIFKFNKPHVGNDHVLTRLSNPNIDPIEKTMRALDHLKKAFELMGVYREN